MTTTLTPSTAQAVICPCCDEAVMMWADEATVTLSLCATRKAAMGGFAASATTHSAVWAERCEPVIAIADWPAPMRESFIARAV